jgi:hypothetical protein
VRRVGVLCCRKELLGVVIPGAWDSQLARPTTDLSHGSLLAYTLLYTACQVAATRIDR